MKRCIIFSAGTFYGLQRRPSPDDYVIAADAGYLACLVAGVTPDLLLGDFDSLERPKDFPNDIRTAPIEKDDTDTMLAVRAGLENGCDTFYFYGATGGKRLDHTIANFQTLLWLRQQGADRAYMDDAWNVIFPVGDIENKPLAVFAAHSDVVFPDTEPLPLSQQDGKIFCPGIGDDTACVAALLMAAKYIAKTGLTPRNCGMLLVINSGEEGLGNLKGRRTLFADFGSRIREFITFDDRNCRCVNRAVGSMRYRITVRTEGGHSYNAFGNPNAIALLAELIQTLYAVQLPPQGKTTYNVGTVTGGTSVNTIAQEAEMLYEFRSDCQESLAAMEAFLSGTLEAFRARGIRIDVSSVGDRPCSGEVDPAAMQALTDRACQATRRYFDRELEFFSGSTDCNIPLSLGIPALCLGCVDGAGAHTREEYVTLDSLLPGLKFVFDMILYHF